MPSSFAWLDYSDGERRRVLDVVRSLNEKDTRDELGVATVRDALADLLAPGISTIQTRVRYFLFLPWIYQQLEERVRRRSVAVTKDWVAQRARSAEIELIPYLLGSGDAYGTIGSSAGKGLQRLPSSVYWNGLGEWGIRQCPLSVDAYHHRLAVYGPPSRSAGGDDFRDRPNWHAGLPPMPEGFPAGAKMGLESGEAEYLCERILETQPDSLLGQLVLSGLAVDDLQYPWDVLDREPGIAPGVARAVRHAREFALAMHGAALLYNLMLAEAVGDQRPDWVDRYRALLKDWAAEVDSRSTEYAAWDRTDFWDTVERTRPNVPLGSRQFINAWLDRLYSADNPFELVDCSYCRNLIEKRESRLKKNQARLHNSRLLELWNGDTGAGAGRMNFRWSVLRDHLSDIHAARDTMAGAVNA